MDHLSAAGSSATRNLTTTEPSESLNRRKTVDFRFQRPHATSGSFFFNKPMRAMDSRRDFTSKKVFSGYFSELGEKANSALKKCALCAFVLKRGGVQGKKKRGGVQRCRRGPRGFVTFPWDLKFPKTPRVAAPAHVDSAMDSACTNTNAPLRAVRLSQRTLVTPGAQSAAGGGTKSVIVIIIIRWARPCPPSPWR